MVTYSKEQIHEWIKEAKQLLADPNIDEEKTEHAIREMGDMMPISAADTGQFGLSCCTPAPLGEFDATCCF